jgi:integrase
VLRQQRERTTAIEHETGQIVQWVFHRRGKPIRGFREAWQEACTAAGCPGRLLHDLRRTAVRNFKRAGVSRSVAMKLTGHKTESIYRRYAIVSGADLAEGMRKVATMTSTESNGDHASRSSANGHAEIEHSLSTIRESRR